MIALPSGGRVWLATGDTDMCKGFTSLALQVQEVLRRDPHGGHLCVFHGRWGDLFSKRLEWGRFLWPSPADGVVTVTLAQLGYLLEGIDWWSWRPAATGRGCAHAAGDECVSTPAVVSLFDIVSSDLVTAHTVILAERAALLKAEATAAGGWAANSSAAALISRLKLEIEKFPRELYGAHSERKI